jgi:uncharacterized membrane protein
MTNSNPYSTAPSQKISKAIPVTFLTASFLGFLDAAYLTVEHYSGVAIRCSLFNNGCVEVLRSVYSTIAGVPVSLLGSLYYLVILILTIAYLDFKKDAILKTAAWGTLAGLAASAWFVFLQVFVIKALCMYCLFSAVTSAALFIAGICAIRRIKGIKQ